MEKRPVKVAIVDDHVLLAESLGAWIKRQPDMQLVGQAEDGEAGVALCETTRPDVALVDVDLPNLDGFEVVKRLQEGQPAIRLITMTGRMDPYTIWRVSQSGVHGYTEKTVRPEVLVDAIRLVASGGTYFSPTFQRVRQDWLAQPEAFQKILSDREQEVLRRVVAGWDDEKIAGQMGITATTVGVHRKHIRQKLELHNDRELVGYARRWGLDKT
jgi:DNA-binding NarL/FixJ family response regulator